MQLKDSVKLMRGRPGDPVNISIQREGTEEPISLSIKRAIIPIESVLGDRRKDDGQWVFRLQEDERIAYVRLTTFGKQTVSELTKTLQKGSNGYDYKGLILDLRGNAGGLLTSAVKTCDMFIADGKIVSTRSRGGKERSVREATSKTVVDSSIPLVVLVNNYSASASEIVAACLQDHQRALIVGERTWGKGTVQNIIAMEGGKSAIKLTTASYWRPSNKNIHRGKDAKDTDDWGVSPNEGYEVKIEEKDAEGIAKWRRFRDIVQPSGAPRPEDVKPVPDPQIKAALKYLGEKLTSD